MSFRVLHIVNKWIQGGLERFVEGVVRDCSVDGVGHSILSVCTDVPSDADCPKYGPLNDELGMASMLKGSRRLGPFLREHRFDAVHVHTQNSSGFLYCRIAERAGVPLRIVHSHNSSLGPGNRLVKGAAQGAIRALYFGSENVRLACSGAAGEHLFPGRDFKVVPNGIDIERFRFDPLARAEIRSVLGVGEGRFLVGCVGSMIEAKNHMRALSVFAELKREEPLAFLLILGDGELRGALEAEAARLGISDSVAMPGFVDDAHSWYSAMDALLFPSLYEGLPIALVEAQCNGLPVICSDTVTPEVALLESFCRLSLSAPDTDWASALLSSERDATGASAEAVRMKGFDRRDTAHMLLAIYRGEL